MQDKVLVVTGGGSGIGRAVVELAAQRGTAIAIVDATGQSAADAAEKSLRLGAPAALGLECDVRDEAAVAAAFEQVVAELGPPTGLFTSAGIDIGGLAHELEFSDWRRVIATNLDGTFLSCKFAIKAMLAAERPGAILCCSSPASFVAFAAGGTSAYSASKGAVSALVRSLAVDYARYGIRVNALVPGSTETPLMWANVPDEQRPAMRATLAGEIPLGRLAAPAEPARAALWLLSEDAAYVTGSHLVCDGGTLAKGSVSV